MKVLNFTNHVSIILTLIAAALFIDSLKLDIWLANSLYQLQGQQWFLRDHFITETILHNGARKLLVIFSLGILCLAISSHWLRSLQTMKRPLWFLFLSLITAPALVAIGKAVTHMDCPWDIDLLGGQYPYLHLLQPHPETWRYGQCFPGGHSSGGFSLVALYFFSVQIKPEWRLAAMTIGLSMGTTFALTQQLRGAHFLSHDLWSLAICWATCLTYQRIIFAPIQNPLLT